MRSSISVTCLLALCLAWPAGAALSDNLFVNGDFESTANIRNTTAPDGAEPHHFSQTYDLGGWFSHWGPRNNPGGLGGISLFDDPRDVNVVGGNNMATGTLGNFNRSVDPLNPGNHILESVMFRPSASQWIAAPANQVPGPIRFSYDFLIHDGYTYDSWGTISVYGMNYLPPDGITVFRDPSPGAPNATYNILDPDLNPDDGQLLFSFTYGEWIDGSTNGIDPPFVYNDLWNHYDTAEYLTDINGAPIEPDGSPDYQWWGPRTVIQSIDQTYDYYVVAINECIYDESDPYFWLYDWRITPEFQFGYDNINLQVSVADARDPFSPGDMNLDGLVNVQDINPFVTALGSEAAYMAYLNG
ncbi:MAG: hypothetical protein IT441_05380, partial [Phycisphaeraceae bacterium]|nr:hypothetical protein [Phycisphaeraceae bacterium]